MNENTAASMDWEAHFEQATEDIMTFQWAVSVWHDPPKDTSADYLLISICANRFRGCAALKMMQQPDLPENYHPNRSRLEAIWHETEQKFAGLLKSDKQQIGSIIETDMMTRLNWLENKLEMVETISEDIIISDETEWFSSDLKDTAQDFLLFFQDIAFVRQELSGCDVLSQKFETSFLHLESFFKDIFGYFKPFSDFLTSMREREYGTDNWWLTEIPDPDKVIHRDFSTEDFISMMNAYGNKQAINISNCPKPDRLIAFALDELGKDHCTDIVGHIQTCRPCKSFVQDIRSASIEAEGKRDKKPVVSNDLLATIGRDIRKEVDERLMALAIVYRTLVITRVRMQRIHHKKFTMGSADSGMPCNGAEGIPLTMTLTPHSESVQVPCMGDQEGGKEFIQNLLQGPTFYTHTFTWDSTGVRTDLGRFFHDRKHRKRDIAISGITDILMIVSTDMTGLDDAARNIPKWLEEGTGNIQSDQIPDSVVLLWYRVAVGGGADGKQ
jgi:hypothetical protein